MKRWLIVLLAMSAPAPAAAQHQHQGSGSMGEADSGHNAAERSPEHRRVEGADAPAGYVREDQPPADAPSGHVREDQPSADAFRGPRHAADALFGAGTMAAERERLAWETGGMTAWQLMGERLEIGTGESNERYLWDLQAWYGGDTSKLWLESAGEGAFGDGPEKIELQALYSRALAPFFDLQAGVRYDFRPDPERAHLVLGLQGLAPYLFEVGAALFVSHHGDLTGRLEGEYDLAITRRLVLQPRVELELAAQDVPRLGIGAGFTDIEAGLRLRYEIRRELAPYIGVGWERKLGETADLARAAAEETSDWRVVVGLRAWY